MDLLSRRSLFSRTTAATIGSISLLPGSAANAARKEEYYPVSDAKGGWRALHDPAEIRKKTRVDVGRLDQALQYVKTTSRHGGLLVVRHGHLVYEKYFGRGDREANPNMYSIAKMFTSVSCGIMLEEHKDKFPGGLNQRVFTRDYLPEAFPLDSEKMSEIRLGHLLTMTSGIAAPSRLPGFPPPRPKGQLRGIVHGENVAIDYEIVPDAPSDQDGSALHGIRMWTEPGAGYLYSRDPHIASIVLRHAVGMELQQYIGQKLAAPMQFGRWGYALHYGSVTLPHTPGEGFIALRSTDAVRFGYLLLRGGKWEGRQLIPAEYVAQCQKPSPFNPHCPFSLQFEVNQDGHVAGAPRDAFFKSGAGGFGLYMVPSLDLVVYKMSSLNDGTYDPAQTGLALAYKPDTSRDTWKPHPLNQFLDGPIEGDAGVRRTLEMVVASIVE